MDDPDQLLLSSIYALGGKGILTQEDIDQLNRAALRVFALMSDQKWHTTHEIDMAAGKDGVPAREGMRRARELRQVGTLEKKRLPDRRQWVYRFTPTKEQP